MKPTVLWSALIIAGIVMIGYWQQRVSTNTSSSRGSALTTPTQQHPTSSLFATPSGTQLTEDESDETSSEKRVTMQAPKMQIDPTKTYTANLKTSEGEISVALTADLTPITVNNFVSLAKSDFYNNTVFHRVIKGFMIQGGDPDGNGSGGPGYRFDDEPFTGEYTRGTVAMANAGPNTNGSQFFIIHQDTPLPKNYVIFGKVIAGIDVVDRIAQAQVTVSPNGEQSTPVNPVVVHSVEVVEK